MSISISFKPDFKTRVYGPGSVGKGYEPIAKVGKEGEPIYIYGSLIVEIDGRRVPWMGYWGPDMVEFWLWITEVSHMLIGFDKGDNEYEYDPIEQEQPAFKYVRDGDTVKLSVVASAHTNGRTDPEWQ